MTQTDSDAMLKWFFRQNSINDLYRQVEKTQKQIVGTKMGSTAGNDQNTLFVWFYAKNLK